MILKNTNNTVREVAVLFEIEKDKNKYVVYEDYNTLNIYVGKYDKNKLKPVNDKEFNMVNNIFKKIDSD